MIGSLFKKIFSRKTTDEPTDAAVDALRIEFKDRYHSFKLLLSANHKALEIMADIEESLRAPKPFGMTFVRAACTSAAVNVFSMVRNLEKLAPEKYTGLFERFPCRSPASLKKSFPERTRMRTPKTSAPCASSSRTGTTASSCC